MENLISEELLSEVLEKEVSIWDKNEIKNNILEIGISLPSGGRLYKELNIYELAHRCKEWAIGNYGFSLHSFPCHDNTYTCEIYRFHKSTGYMIIDWFNCLSETEAIFEACQWILDNKGIK